VAQGTGIVRGRVVPLGPGPVLPANYQATIAATLDVSQDDAARIAAVYPLAGHPSPSGALSDVLTDAGFACPTFQMNRWLSDFVPVFAYEFRDAIAPQRFLWPMHVPYGAAHGSELQYFFDLPTAPFEAGLTLAQSALASTMRHYWASFADGGAPLSYGSPRWPPFDAETQQVLALDTSGAHPREDFVADHQCWLWSTLG
jgi:para-nitrobenzyl esterase